MNPRLLRPLRCALLGLFTAVLAQDTSTTPDLGPLGGKAVEREGKIVEFQGDTDAWDAAAFDLLGRCVTLKKLSLNGKTLTDDTLPRLAGLVNLEELSTNGSRLSDDGYRHFAAFRNLRKLALWHPSWGYDRFTGSGLIHLKALPKLESLTFAGATAGDAALRAIGELENLREFSTWHTAQTQAGNEALTRLPHLAKLRIGQRLPPWGKDCPPSLDGTSLTTLARIPSLERLELFEIRLRPEAVKPLAGRTTLRQLVIHTSDVTAEEADRMRALLPGVALEHRPTPAEEQQAMLVKKLRL